MAVSFDRQRLGPLKDTVAIVGVGETDYGADYRGAGGRAVGKGEARYDSYTLASKAFKRALDDAGRHALGHALGLSGARARLDQQVDVEALPDQVALILVRRRPMSLGVLRLREMGLTHEPSASGRDRAPCDRGRKRGGTGSDIEPRGMGP